MTQEPRNSSGIASRSFSTGCLTPNFNKLVNVKSCVKTSIGFLFHGHRFKMDFNPKRNIKSYVVNIDTKFFQLFPRQM